MRSTICYTVGESIHELVVEAPHIQHQMFPDHSALIMLRNDPFSEPYEIVQLSTVWVIRTDRGPSSSEERATPS
jgi:hypothetical protein